MKYISLFSSAGIGTFGLHQDGHECIATNELLPERMMFQKLNNISLDKNAYITGDITKSETIKLIYNQIKKHGQPDIIIATPPCQGISLLNLKKNNNDKYRNSLVVESLEIIKETQPSIFILENVQRFLSTACLQDGEWKEIKDAIVHKLGDKYSIAFKQLNLKHIGSNSSRTRTIVIGIDKKKAKHYSPWELFPSKVKKIPTLWNVIKKNKKLEWGETDIKDFYHSFRIYDNRMKPWITNLEPGQSAFDNYEIENKPHKIVNGKLVLNKNSTGDKYKRQYPDKVAQCIMTRNDQLASQNTIHPYDDRVFSIRELMQLMTIPKQFKFFDISNEQYWKMNANNRNKYYKKNELNIRRSIGEAVPTFLFRDIINNFFVNERKVKLNSQGDIDKYIKSNNLIETSDLHPHIEKVSRVSLNLLFEKLENKAKETGLYFTNPDIVTDLLNDIKFKGKRVLEPSVGLGSFIIPFIKAFPELELEVVAFDINIEALKLLNCMTKNDRSIKMINKDFLTHTEVTSDLVIGNPPYVQINKNSKYNINNNARNLFELFVFKTLEISKEVIFILPKYILFNNKYSQFREYMKNHGIKRIWDYKGMLFPNAKIETIGIHLVNNPTKEFISDGKIYKIDRLFNKRSTIWTIHPNKILSKYGESLIFDDQMKSTRMLKFKPRMTSNNGMIKVVTSANLRGSKDFLKVNKGEFIKEQNEIGILVPNMTKNIRGVRKKRGEIWNGSLALIKSNKFSESEMMSEWNSDIFRDYINMLRSGAERSINIDKQILRHFGVKGDAND